MLCTGLAFGNLDFIGRLCSVQALRCNVNNPTQQTSW